MASFNLLGLLAIVLIAHLAMAAMATNYTVGDDKGWTVNFDYKEWAKGKEFMVGDKLSMSLTTPSNHCLIFVIIYVSVFFILVIINKQYCMT